MRVAVDCPDNVLVTVSGSSLVRMWLEVSVGLGSELWRSVGTFGFSCTSTAVACSRVSSNCVCQSIFGLAAESMPAESMYVSHSRVETLFSAHTCVC